MYVARSKQSMCCLPVPALDAEPLVELAALSPTFTFSLSFFAPVISALPASCLAGGMPTGESDDVSFL
jgi:hypothetical protein